jgi:hypothetical protein
LNYITWIRFAPADANGVPEDYHDADAVIIALSGMHAANDGYDTFGKTLVAKAKAKGQNVEVWAIDRRVNNLEDTTALDYLENLAKHGQVPDRATAAEILNNYYWNYSPTGKNPLPYKTITDPWAINPFTGVQGESHTFAGFYTDQPVAGQPYRSAPWLSEFGLRMAMEDIRTVITTHFDQTAGSTNNSKKKVYIAGDSLGAVETADFAAWDFNGTAGHKYIAGIIGLDAQLMTSAIPISVNSSLLNMGLSFLPGNLADLINTTSLSVYSATLDGLRNGTVSPYLQTSDAGYVPTTYIGAEVTSMLADMAPDAESAFYLDQAPESMLDPRTNVMLKIAFSKDLNDFLSTKVYQKYVRFTNEALLGIALDNNFNPITMNEATMGFLASVAKSGTITDSTGRAYVTNYAAGTDSAGLVEEKSFPSKGGLQKVLWSFIWKPLSGMLPYAKMYIPKDPAARSATKYQSAGPLYTWVNFNHIGDTTGPLSKQAAFARKYTTSASEVTDLHDLAKCFYDGPSNVAEWYYTTRFFSDVLIGTTSGASNYGIRILHANELKNVPQTIWMNKNGTNIVYAQMNGVKINGTLPGTHLDVMMMSMDKPGVSAATSEGYMITPLCDWMKKTSAAVDPAPTPTPAPTPAPAPSPKPWWQWW